MNLTKEELDLLHAAVSQYTIAYGDWRKSLHWLTDSTSRQLAVERESLIKLDRALKEEAGNQYHDLQCENKIVTFVYRNHRGDEESRTVTVHRLEVQSIDNDYYKRGTLLLRGYCHDRKAMRSFALKNILTRIKPYMEEPAEVSTSTNVEEAKAQSFQQEAPQQPALDLFAVGDVIKSYKHPAEHAFTVLGYYHEPQCSWYVAKPIRMYCVDPVLLLAGQCYKARPGDAVKVF